ncbi:hypothetical protein KKA69_06410 [Patescibacteria group bacterium]|nr:hypothetical protein [Patescibacteria group bacterium]
MTQQIIFDKEKSMNTHLRKYMISIIVFAFLTIFAFESIQADTTHAIVERNAEIHIGDCSWNGTKSLTDVTVTVTNTRLTIFGPLYQIGPLFNQHSGMSFSLEPGDYRYEWYQGYDNTFYVWTNKIIDYFTLNECIPQASASITTGTCTWNDTNGSITPVTITLDHASLSLNGTSYTAPQTTITDLQPGTYPYSWVATGGYQGGESNKTLIIPDCTPLPTNVYATNGTCGWTSTQGSKTPVTLNITGASGTLNGPGGTLGSYNSSNSPVPLSLSPGNYSFDFTAETGYRGSGTENISVAACNPTASVSHSIEDCTFQNNESSTSVSFDISGADVTLSGPEGASYHPSMENSAFDLPSGFYTYNWAVHPYYDGENGSNNFTLGTCIPAQVSYAISDCKWTDDLATREISFTVSGAVVTLTGPGGPFSPFSVDTNFTDVPEGSFSFDWVSQTGYAGTGQGEFNLPACIPGVANVTVNFKECSLDDENPVANLEILLDNAILSIDDEIYTASAPLTLPPGLYSYEWWGKPGFEGDGEGQIDTTSCAPKLAPEVNIEAGSCKYNGKDSTTDVFLTLVGASVIFQGSNGESYGPFSVNQTIQLPPGSYQFEWQSVDGFEGKGEGGIQIDSCEPSKEPPEEDEEEKAQENDQSEVGITVEASTSTTLPDLPAGGTGPRIFNFTIPLLIGLSGSGLSLALIFKNKRRSH